MTAENEPHRAATERHEPTEPSDPSATPAAYPTPRASGAHPVRPAHDLKRRRDARTQGLQAAEMSTATGRQLAAKQALDEPIASSQTLAAADVHAKMGQPPCGHPNTTGQLNLRPATTGQIAPTDITRTKRSATRAPLLRAAGGEVTAHELGSSVDHSALPGWVQAVMS